MNVTANGILDGRILGEERDDAVSVALSGQLDVTPDGLGDLLGVRHERDRIEAVIAGRAAASNGCCAAGRRRWATLRHDRTYSPPAALCDRARVSCFAEPQIDGPAGNPPEHDRVADRVAAGDIAWTEHVA